MGYEIGMYSVAEYGDMLTDRARMAAYEGALREVVKPGDVVIDLGAGTCHFGLLACKLGAKRVHCIEPNDAIFVGRELAKEIGFEDRMTFHHALSTDVSLAEKADVIVSDLRGANPVNTGHIASLHDARSRLLRVGGTLLPQKDDLLVSLVQSEHLYARFHSPWDRPGLGIMRAAWRSVANTVHGIAANDLELGDLVSEPIVWTTLDYAAPPLKSYGGKVELRAEREATVHGLVLWFHSTLLAGFDFASGPCREDSVYGHIWLPLEEPWRVVPEERVEVTLQVTAEGEEWGWALESGGRRVQQSTFLGTPSLERFALRADPSRMPAVADEKRALGLGRFLLDGTRALTQVADRLVADFPKSFPDRDVALRKLCSNL